MRVDTRPVLLVCILLLTPSSTSAQVDDHLECHKIKDPQAKLQYTADIDGLVARSGCVLKTPAAMACLPATKSNVAPPAPGAEDGATTNGYLCYKLKCPKAVLPTVAAEDQFGSRSLTPTSTKLLCAPLAAPAPTTTTLPPATTTTTLPDVDEGATFRMSSLALRDPHVFSQVSICLDLTSQVNQNYSDRMTTDSDSDSDLDMSLLLDFSPLLQTVPGSGNLEFLAGECSAPVAGTSCTPDGVATALTYSNASSGSCLDLIPGTTRPSYGSITLPSAPCFGSSSATTIFVPFLDTLLPLRDAQVAATYDGDPAVQLDNGLLRGFLTEADADSIIIPASVAVVGGKAVSAVLPGGTDNCRTGANSDLDSHNSTSGWWFYFNFSADPVPFSE